MSVSGASGSNPTSGTSGSEGPDNPPAPPSGGSPDFKSPISGLKNMTPEEMQKYLQLLAQNMCTEMKKSNDKLIQEMKKTRQQGG